MPRIKVDVDEKQETPTRIRRSHGTRDLTLVAFVSVLALVATVAPVARHATVRRPDPVFTWNGQQFRPVGVNYYPATHPWTGTWTEFNATELARDFKLVKDLGGNCIRTFIQWYLVEPEPWVFNQTIIDRIVEFFNVASNEGIAVMFSFFDFGPPAWAGLEPGMGDEMYVNETLIAHQVAQLQAIIPLINETSAAFMWDLRNEPKSSRIEMSRFVLWVENLTATIRGMGDTHYIVVGGGYGNFENPAAYAHLVDAVCMHFYQARDQPQWVRNLEKYHRMFAAAGKPVILQEFGWPSFGAISEDAQASLYRVMLEKADELEFAGVMAWCLWEYSNLWKESEEHFGLVRMDGSWKPAAHVFKDYATGNRQPTWGFSGLEALY